MRTDDGGADEEDDADELDGMPRILAGLVLMRKTSAGHHDHDDEDDDDDGL